MSGAGIVLGVDGGGTSTRAVLAGADGTLLGWGQAGPSNYGDVGVDAARANIRLAIEQAWQQAGLSQCPAGAAFLGMAGVVSPADRAVISGMALDLNLADPEKTGIDHDIRIALAGGLALRPGIVLIAGTGSSCYARGADGASCRVGGWGHLLDDGGSGYSLGMEAMRAAVRSVDGRLGATALLDGVLSALGLQDINDIMYRLYHLQMSRAEIAALAPMVLETAQRGDPAARSIVQRGQAELAECVETAARCLNFGPGPVRVVVTGGLAHSGDYYKQSLYDSIRARLPGVEIQEPELSPTHGAALLALELLLGGMPSPDIISKMRIWYVKK